MPGRSSMRLSWRTYARWMSEGRWGSHVDRQVSKAIRAAEEDGHSNFEDIRIRHPWSIYTPALAVADKHLWSGAGYRWPAGGTNDAATPRPWRCSRRSRGRGCRRPDGCLAHGAGQRGAHRALPADRVGGRGRTLCTAPSGRPKAEVREPDGRYAARRCSVRREGYASRRVARHGFRGAGPYGRADRGVRCGGRSSSRNRRLRRFVAGGFLRTQRPSGLGARRLRTRVCARARLRRAFLLADSLVRGAEIRASD